MIVKNITDSAINAVKSLYGAELPAEQFVIQPTREGIKGDFTLVVFPMTKVSHKAPAATAEEIGERVTNDVPEIESYSVINGFLNFTLKNSYWVDFLNENYENETFGGGEKNSGDKIVIEFSSPNTNKPLHLGHVRNNLIGMAVSNILSAAGNEVVKVNLVNDRGIHICKSMIAWLKWGNCETPESSSKKGDHLVGDYYVEFDKHFKEDVKLLENKGMTEDEAKEKAPLTNETRQMLVKWEAEDKDVRALWEMMNEWVYAGFDVTYKRLGVSFDKIYYESQTYLLGKKVVADALQKGLITKDPDNSVWIDLTNEGLDRKLLLRKDGTSVYITQDIGTALLRYNEFHPDKMIYVVGNEQIYHFDVLKLTLKRFGYDWADFIYHLSYGMVELTTGKMKSREGTVVDADELMDEMKSTAMDIIREQGKVEYGTREAEDLSEMVGLAALKYYILKVDPKKQMLFNPAESIDFNGNTGPFIQYTHARIRSLLARASAQTETNTLDNQFRLDGEDVVFNEVEQQLLRSLHDYSVMLEKAAKDYSPAQVANYAFELAKLYNRFYQDTPVLKETDERLRKMRLMLSLFVANNIKNSMKLLGINVPDKM